MGNIILDLDYASMSRVLKIPSVKFRDKVAKSMMEWVTSIKRETGNRPSAGVVKELLAEGYKEVLGINLEPAEPTIREWATWEGEVKPRHVSNEWLYMPEMRHKRLMRERAVKVAGDVKIVEVEYKAKKLIRVTAELVGGEVRDLMLSGDFFMMPEDGLPKLESALNGAHLDRDDMLRRVLAVYKGGIIQTPGIGPEDFTEAMMKLKDLIP